MGQLTIITTNESKVHLKHNRLVESNDVVHWKKKTWGKTHAKLDTLKEAIKWLIRPKLRNLWPLKRHN